MDIINKELIQTPRSLSKLNEMQRFGLLMTDATNPDVMLCALQSTIEKLPQMTLSIVVDLFQAFDELIETIEDEDDTKPTIEDGHNAGLNARRLAVLCELIEATAWLEVTEENRGGNLWLVVTSKLGGLCEIDTTSAPPLLVINTAIDFVVSSIMTA